MQARRPITLLHRTLSLGLLFVRYIRAPVQMGTVRSLLQTVRLYRSLMTIGRNMPITDLMRHLCATGPLAAPQAHLLPSAPHASDTYSPLSWDRHDSI